MYVYDATAIREQYRRLDAALRSVPHRIHYAVKANSTLAVLCVLREAGAGLDIVSGGELARALRAGFAPQDIVFSGVGKTGAELAQAVAVGVGMLNVESRGELEAVAELATVRPVRIGIRVNPEVTTETHPYTRTGDKGMKFGVPLDDVLPLAERALGLPTVRLAGISMHIGSQILDPSRYAVGAEKLAGLVAALRALGVGTLEAVGVGGGLGIRYTDEVPIAPEAFAAAVGPLATETGLTLVLEPGRYLVGNAGVLLTRCLYRKHSGGREFAIVDAGMNDLLRPALYQATHRIVRVCRGGAAAPEHGGERVDIVGPNCETGDFLGLDVPLDGVAPGDLLAVRDVGAYGFTMSSTYNSRPRAAEALVDGDRWAVIRERDTIEDLMRGERTLGEIDEWHR